MNKQAEQTLERLNDLYEAGDYIGFMQEFEIVCNHPQELLIAIHPYLKKRLVVLLHWCSEHIHKQTPRKGSPKVDYSSLDLEGLERWKVHHRERFKQ